MPQLAVIYDTSSGQFLFQPLGTAHILSGAIQSGLIGNAAVVSGSFASGQIFWPHVAPQAILSAQLGSGQVGGVHLADGLIQSADIGSGQIGGFQIAAGALISANYGSGSIGGRHFAAGGVVSAAYASGSIGAEHLGAGPWLTSIFSGTVVSLMARDQLIFSGLGRISMDAAPLMRIDANIVSGNVVPVSGLHVSINVDARDSVISTVFSVQAGYAQAGSGQSLGDKFQVSLSSEIFAATVGSANYRSGTIAGAHLAAATIASANLASGLARLMHAFIGSADANGFWSAAWGTGFPVLPVAVATPLVASGLYRQAVLLNVLSALINGQLIQSGGVAGASGAVHVMATVPTF